MSWRPNRPPSPACGLSAATAIRARATPRSRSASWVRSMTRRSRSGVSRFGTSSSATCVRDVADPHVAVRQHHHRAAHAGELRQHLGMAGIVVAGLVQRLLVEGCGDDALRPDRPGPGARRARRPGRRTGRRRPTARPGRIGSPSGPACRKASAGQSAVLGRPPGSRLPMPSCARAARSAGPLPMTSSRSSPAARRSRSFPHALTMISGPTPAGSPIVMARCGRMLSLAPDDRLLCLSRSLRPWLSSL